MSRRQRTFIGPQGMGGLVSLWGQASPIKLIQRGTISIAAGATSGTASINSVIQENCRMRFLNFTSDNVADGGTDGSTLFCRATLTSSTVVTAVRNSSDPSYGRVISFEVTEYNPGYIKSIQRGTVVMAGVTSATATITAVDPNKSEVDWLGWMTNFTAPSNNVWCSKCVLTNATTVTGTVINSAGSITQNFQVTEFY